MLKSYNGNISKTVSPIKLKFEAQLETTWYKFKNTKLGHKGALPGSLDLLLNFGTPLISLERLKIHTSNFACCLIVRDTK